MSSYMTDVISYTRPHNFPAQIHQHQNTTTHYDPSIPHSQTTYPFATDTYDQASIISHALALLNPNRESCMNDEFADSHPNIRVESSTPLPPGGYDGRQDSVIAAYAPIPHDWQMYQTSMSTRRPLKRARSHQRTPSASTVASNGPASPYTATTSYPHVANTDFSPNSPIHYADQPAFFSKNLPTPQQTPTDATFMNAGYMTTNYTSDASSANWAMRGFPGNFSNSEDLPPEFLHSSRHSMSSGHDSPATPQSGVGEIGDSKNYNMNQNGETALDESESEIDYLPYNLDFRQPNPNVQLFRTESSQAYSDELYNPQNFTSVPAAQGNNSAAKANHSAFLSPHRNIINERLQTANLARSSSPTSAVSRERSPFRDGSPLAPTGDWKPNRNAIGTAAGMRQQQREDAAQAEYAQHQPALQREPTKTISPKDALLDYSESEQPPLFQDNVPIGYRQHTSGSETWQNDFMNQPSATFGNLSAPANTQQQMPPYHATANDGFNEANLGYYSLPPAHPDQASQIQVTPFQPNSYAGQKMNYADATPEFPATLTSMESSVSEGGQFPSSQDNYNQATAQRPLDTRANTGTYTCTYHGCTQRFDSHINLQKHKRDYHRSQQNKDSPSTTGTESNNSPRSTESPAPSSSGMTSAAILARNSQAGPHKCTRINPSTNKPCNTIFSRPYDLTRHEDTIHNNRKQKVRCPMCREEKTFSRNDALTRHMRVVHPEVESFGKRSRRGD